MCPKERPVEPEHIECETCLKEIPRDEAKSDEGTDYIVHFCGLECYNTWKERQKEEGKSG